MSGSELSVFLKQFVRRPHRVVAVAPSSGALARRMALALPQERQGPVVELGAGTGKITSALIAAGVGQSDLHALEVNGAFVDVLKREYPGLHVHRMGAENLDRLRLSGVRAVVSGLPLLSMPRGVQRAILEASFRAMGPGGVFIQFTYGANPPVAERIRRDLGLVWSKSDRVWGNLPPARVYCFRQTLH